MRIRTDLIARTGRYSILAFIFGLLLVISSFPPQLARAQEPASLKQTAEPAKADSAKEPDASAAGKKSFGGELAEQTREATGAEPEEEHSDLKHSFPVKWLAKKLGLDVHQTHLLLMTINFAIVAGIIIWAAFKFLPAMFRNRSTAIQQALAEARAASEDANRRLGDIENRLRQLDTEIGRMQSTAEGEAAAEETRIQKAAEEEIRKVVLAAEHEIETAAKQARRELTNHTAGLAISLARQQINVDANTDQVLVRNFASKLASPASPKSGNDGKDGQ